MVIWLCRLPLFILNNRQTLTIYDNSQNATCIKLASEFFTIQCSIQDSRDQRFEIRLTEFPNTKAQHPASPGSRYVNLPHRMSLKSSFSFVKPFLFNYFGRILLSLRFLVLNTFDYKKLFLLIYSQLRAPPV